MSNKAQTTHWEVLELLGIWFSLCRIRKKSPHLYVVSETTVLCSSHIFKGKPLIHSTIHRAQRSFHPCSQRVLPDPHFALIQPCSHPPWCLRGCALPATAKGAAFKAWPQLAAWRSSAFGISSAIKNRALVDKMNWESTRAPALCAGLFKELLWEITVFLLNWKNGAEKGICLLLPRVLADSESDKRKHGICGHLALDCGI